MKVSWPTVVLSALAALVLVGCQRGNKAATFEYDFGEGDQGWKAGFADLPANYDPALFELESSWQPLPSGLEGNGLYIQGHNRSDDLFMFFKVRVGGLKPNTVYQATFDLELVTDVPGGMMGVGGSPGENVYVKAGATAVEPGVEEDTNGWLRMNVDIGNQSQGGEHMIVLGDIAYEPDGTEEAGRWVLKPLDSEGQPFSAKTDEDGALWLIVGTDSGFEGLTAIYYAQITVGLTGDSGE